MFQERCVKRYLWRSLLVTVFGALLGYGTARYVCGGSLLQGGLAGAAAAFLLLWLYGCKCLWGLCCQVDRVGDVFEEIMAESSLKPSERSPEEAWKDRLPHFMEEGTVGRLENHVLESVHILGQREESHREEQKYLKEMMTDISHQIKTPLAALQVFLEIFEHQFTERKLLDMVTQAKAQVQRIHWLVVGLLQMTRLESGMLPVEKTENDIGVLLRESAERVLHGFAEKHLQIDFQGEEDCRFLCEREWVEEAFQNLLKNCCEFSPEGGAIEVQWIRTQMALTVQITDQGPGIPAEELPKIFQRFYQVKGAGQQTDSNGVGIGLSLARKIIERQGGSLAAYSSTELPSYTRFEVVFML